MAEEVLQCFGGSELRKFDAMGRIAIPNKFRGRFGNENKAYLFKNIHSNESLILYTEEGWKKVYNKLSSLPNDVKAYMQDEFISRIDMLSMDKAGRITVRQDFKEYAELGDEVIILCYPDRIEIRDPEKWEHRQKPASLPDFSTLDISAD